MQPSSFLVNIAQQPEFLSAVSRSDVDLSHKLCYTIFVYFCLFLDCMFLAK